MTVASIPTRFTPDDVLRLEEQGLYELVDGRLVEKTMSSVASKTANRIALHLSLWTQDFKLGEVFPEQSFRCFPSDPDLLRRPDVALILAVRMSGVPSEGHIPIAPDLVVEVISPTDKVYQLDEKLAEYRSAGIKLVWVVNPESRTIKVHYLGRPVPELRDGDVLTGDPLLPGFSVPVSSLLPAAKLE
jgi:Uma2 family endonuclease